MKQSAESMRPRSESRNKNTAVGKTKIIRDVVRYRGNLLMRPIKCCSIQVGLSR